MVYGELSAVATAGGGEPAVEAVAGVGGCGGQGDRGAVEARSSRRPPAALGVEGDGVGGVGRPLGVEGGPARGDGVGRAGAPTKCHRWPR